MWKFLEFHTCLMESEYYNKYNVQLYIISVFNFVVERLMLLLASRETGFKSWLDWLIVREAELEFLKLRKNLVYLSSKNRGKRG